MIDQLKQAADNVNKYRKLIEQEMVEQGNRGRLWKNGMCKDWPKYEAALIEQERLRYKYGV